MLRPRLLPRWLLLTRGFAGSGSRSTGGPTVKPSLPSRPQVPRGGAPAAIFPVTRNTARASVETTPRGAVVYGLEEGDGVQSFRLVSRHFAVDVRLNRINRRWIASADAPDGPTLGLGTTAFAALWMALGPLEQMAGELLASFPEDLVLQL